MKADMYKVLDFLIKHSIEWHTHSLDYISCEKYNFEVRTYNSYEIRYYGIIKRQSHDSVIILLDYANDDVKQLENNILFVTKML